MKNNVSQDEIPYIYEGCVLYVYNYIIIHYTCVDVPSSIDQLVTLFKDR